MTRLCTHAESSADVPGRQSEGRAAVTDGSEQESDAIALAHLQFAASYCFSAHRVSRTTAVRSIRMKSKGRHRDVSKTACIHRAG